MDSSLPAPGYLQGIVRAALSFGGGYLVAKGIITTEQLPEFGGAALAVIVLVWSIVHKIKLSTAVDNALAAGRGFKP